MGGVDAAGEVALVAQDGVVGASPAQAVLPTSRCEITATSHAVPEPRTSTGVCHGVAEDADTDAVAGGEGGGTEATDGDTFGDHAA